MRKIHINDEVWQYKIYGRDFRLAPTIVIWSPEDKKHVVHTSDLFVNMTPDDIEKGMWKGWLHVQPKHIKAYIEREIIPNKLEVQEKHN